MTEVTAFLPDIADLVPGYPFDAALFNDEKNGVPVIRIRDVIRGFSETYYSGKYPTESVVNNGDFLVGMDGEFNIATWNGGTALLNQRVCKIVPRISAVEPSYLLRILPRELKRIEDRTPFVTVKHLSMKELKAIKLSLPPILEQRRIAAILDKADAIGKKRGKIIGLAEDLIKSAFLQLLGHLPDKRISIEELLPTTSNAIRTGPFGSQLLHSEFVEDGIPVLGIDNVVTNRFRWAERRYISTEKYRELSRYRVFPGDVMITIMGTTGRVCIAPPDLPECISTKHLCTITLDRQLLLPEYLWASLLWDPALRAQATREGKGAIMEGWNMGIVRGLMIKRPTIAQQETFAALVQKVEALRANLQASESQAIELFGSLAHRAFNGQL